MSITPLMLNLLPEDIKIWIDKLVYQISNSGKTYDYVLGIERGGLNVSLPLSRFLKLPHKSIRISFYDKSIYSDVEKLFCHPSSEPELSLNGYVWKPNGLLVDDLIDNGRTVQYFLDHFGEIDIAVLLWNAKAKYFFQEPEYFAELKPKEWVVFPWE